MHEHGFLHFCCWIYDFNSIMGYDIDNEFHIFMLSLLKYGWISGSVSVSGVNFYSIKGHLFYFFLHLLFSEIWFWFLSYFWNVMSYDINIIGISLHCSIVACSKQLSIFLAAWWKDSEHFKASLSCAQAWYKTDCDFC